MSEDNFDCIYEDKEASQIVDKLMIWAGFKDAPGCKGGCHVIDLDGVVMSYEKGLRLAFEKLMATPC